MGGIVSPILGFVSDNHGIHAALSCLIIIPFIAVILARKLPTPKSDLANIETDKSKKELVCEKAYTEV